MGILEPIRQHIWLTYIETAPVSQTVSHPPISLHRLMAFLMEFLVYLLPFFVVQFLGFVDLWLQSSPGFFYINMISHISAIFFATHILGFWKKKRKKKHFSGTFLSCICIYDYGWLHDFLLLRSFNLTPRGLNKDCCSFKQPFITHFSWKTLSVIWFKFHCKLFLKA